MGLVVLTAVLLAACLACVGAGVWRALPRSGQSPRLIVSDSHTQHLERGKLSTLHQNVWAHVTLAAKSVPGTAASPRLVCGTNVSMALTPLWDSEVENYRVTDGQFLINASHNDLLYFPVELTPYQSRSGWVAFWPDELTVEMANKKGLRLDVLINGKRVSAPVDPRVLP
jgi:hypothetical protein